MRNLLKTLIVAGIAIGSASCAATVVGGGAAIGTATAMDARGGKQVVNDQTLEHKINNVLSAQVPNGSFTVASYDGHVLLAGQVPNAHAKYKAKTAVENTSGVKRVWNYLTIQPHQTAASVTKDAYLTSAAKTRLIAQKNVNTNNIKVVTNNGVVYLLGYNAGKKSEIRGAITGIQGISGVKKVVDLIQH